MKSAAVSIILPCYNAESTLPACIDSISSQTFDDFEVLAVDDGSTDQSLQILTTWAATDPRVRLIQAGRVGLVAVLNLAISQSGATLLARMDADDIMLPTRLERQVTAMQANPDLALVASQVALFPEELVRDGYREYIRWQHTCHTPAEISANIYIESPFAHPSVMLRRHVLVQLGSYHDGPFPEDYQLWLRIHAAGMPMARIPEVLLNWREHADRTSRTDPRYARANFDQLRARFLANDPRLKQGRPLVYWGAGRPTRLRARNLIEQGFPPTAWIDIDPRKIGQVIWGVPVYPPKWLEQQPRPFILVYVNSHGARDEIAVLLEQYGYQPGVDYLGVG